VFNFEELRGLNMLDCKDASQLISQSLDRSLTLRERFALKLHLFICVFCRRFNQQLQTIQVALKNMRLVVENDESIQLPAKTKSRIANSIESIKN
jgi:hypothetical protein